MTKDELREKIRNGYKPTKEDYLAVMDEKTKSIILIKEELYQIKQWLANNDWKVNKIVVGEWSTDDERWINYLAERQVKRKRQDELNQTLIDYECNTYGNVII